MKLLNVGDFLYSVHSESAHEAYEITKVGLKYYTAKAGCSEITVFKDCLKTKSDRPTQMYAEEQLEERKRELHRANTFSQLRAAASAYSTPKWFDEEACKNAEAIINLYKDHKREEALK